MQSKELSDAVKAAWAAARSQNPLDIPDDHILGVVAACRPHRRNDFLRIAKLVFENKRLLEAKEGAGFDVVDLDFDEEIFSSFRALFLILFQLRRPCAVVISGVC